MHGVGLGEVLPADDRPGRIREQGPPLVDLVEESETDSSSQGSSDALATSRRTNCMTSCTCSSGTGTITYGI